MSDLRSRRVALFIANDTFYSRSLSRLYAPVSDARALRNLLHEPEIGGFEPAEILVNESKMEIERGIERMFRGAGPEDLLLLYYSGHGIRTSQNLYLAASNTDANLPGSSGVSSAFIKEMIRESNAASKIILLDCCYSGAFLSGDALKAGVDLGDGVGEHLATGEGVCVLTACTGVQIAEDGIRSGAADSMPMSTFTSAIVNGITTGLAGNGSGQISTHSLWAYVKDEVRRRTDRQTPGNYGLLNDEVYIAQTRRGPGAANGGDRVLLGSLLGPLEQVRDSGVRAESWWGTSKLCVPIGRQRRPDGAPGDIVQLEFAAPDHGLLIVGRAGSGKSTLLRTLVAALALTHSTDEVCIHVLDSSNRLGSMGDLPHVAEVVGDDQAAAVENMLIGVTEEILNRKKLYRSHRIDSPGRLRAARSGLTDGPVPDLFLILDRWNDFALLPGVEEKVRRIAETGPEYAVHVVATCRDWDEVPDWAARLLTVQIELRLHRSGESRVAADRVPRLPDGAGWALHGEHPFRIALPDIREPAADPAEPDDSDDGASELVDLFRDQGDRARAGQGAAGQELEAKFTDLYEIDDISAPDTDRWWRSGAGDRRLRVPIGVVGPDEPIMLDLERIADGGTGPHGLVAGATGAGKSELLRTIVLGLALRHGPERVSFLLVGVDDRATFEPLACLPHVAGHVRGAKRDLYLLQRLQAVLAGEITERQRYIGDECPYRTIDEYEAARAAGVSLPVMPALVIVIEEFMDLVAGTSTFAEMLVRIGRLGRSLGIHLLLGTQRPDEWQLRDLDSYLSYRIVLRTFSFAQSNLLLKTAAAYHLPRIPGYGYLRTSGGIATRFRAAFVSGPGPVGGADPIDRPMVELLAQALTGRAPRVRQLWTDPLTESPTVGMLLRQWDGAAGAGLPGALRLPLGLVDIPERHRLDVMVADLGGDSGHLAIVGGPRSGKSTVLRTLIMAAAELCTPEQVQFYCLDLGGALADLAELPHIGAVAGRQDTDGLRRIVFDVAGLLDRRVRLFEDVHIGSLREFRSHKADSTEVASQNPAVDAISADAHGDVFLVVDGLDVVHQDHSALGGALSTLAATGARYGIHVVVTLPPWTQFALPDTIGTRIELRLGDPADSRLDRDAAGEVPPNRPGRGLAPDKRHLLVALPRLDADTAAHRLSEGVAATVRRIRTEYGARQAPRVLPLPRMIHRAEVQRAARAAGVVQDSAHVVVGLGERELSPLAVDFAGHPHLMAFADTGFGKTTLLRNILLGLLENATPEQVGILLVDYQGALVRSVDGGSAIVATPVPTEMRAEVERLRSRLRDRIDGIEPAGRRAREGAAGPELYVIVDDYDTVVADGADPLGPLEEFLPMAGDLGLHLVMTRRATGLDKALESGILGCLNKLSTPILMMRAPAEETTALTGDLSADTLSPGRGILRTRSREPELVQISYSS
ncbi:type VII secretion protein EccCb [Nocardia jiangxiensis]|uniref:Type VII secretion protein EccCb n=1 Tax=Nocardia jiangxiensis TaxID=282685 RepID=A0ABW6S7V7_9NOCA|nr:type VII secretion protein EccCb [Nocardia jiangxiensis]